MYRSFKDTYRYTTPCEKLLSNYRFNCRLRKLCIGFKCQTPYNYRARIHAASRLPFAVYVKGKRSASRARARTPISLSATSRLSRLSYRCDAASAASHSRLLFSLSLRLRRGVMYAARHRCNVHRVSKRSRWHDCWFSL